MSIFSNDFWYETPTFATHAILAAKNFTAKTGQYRENFKSDFPKISRLKSEDIRKIHFGKLGKI